jgi:hypothetical protein
MEGAKEGPFVFDRILQVKSRQPRLVMRSPLGLVSADMPITANSY